MKIYIDFDGTLFDSTKHYQEYKNIFKKYNIDIESYSNKEYKKEKNYDILTKKIIKEYNLNPSIYKEIDKIYSEKLIFKDAITFLKKYHNKYELILLTLGNIDYQQKKINKTNISKYFKDIIITNKDKSRLDIDYTNGIFIDNNPLELKKFYNSKAKYLIRIKRETDKYSKIDLDIKNIPEFINFDELTKSNYIKQIGENYHE